jgi:hypothetical protein
MMACNFPFNFILKELLYVKNNSSKYELNLTAALKLNSVACSPQANYTDRAAAAC